MNLIISMVLSGSAAALLLNAQAVAMDVSQAKVWCRQRDASVSADLQISACNTLIGSGSESPEDRARTLYSRGNGYQDKGDYDRAIQDYDEALKLNPHSPPALYFRGNAYARKANYDRAIKDYDEALRLYPEYADAHNARAIAIKRRAEVYRAKGMPVAK